LKSKEKSSFAGFAYNLTEEDVCYICRDTTRDKDVICVWKSGCPGGY